MPIQDISRINGPISSPTGNDASSLPTDYKPLFEEAIPTEAELRGEVIVSEGGAESGEEEGQAEEAGTKETQQSGSDAQTAEEKEGQKEKVEEGKKEETKPPEGYVPLAALHEERLQRKMLAGEIERLKKEIEILKNLPAEEGAEAAGKEEKAFRVLSEKEEDELMENDIFAYQKYLRQLRKYNEQQAREHMVKQQEERVTQEAYKMMNQFVPGVLDENSDINEKLTKYSVEHGLTPEILAIMTDPRTKIILPGQKDAAMLGPAAAYIAKFIYETYNKTNQSKDEQALRAEIEKSLRNKLTEEITKELMDKIKTGKTEAGYRSIGDVAGGGEIPNIEGPITEDDFRKMTPEQIEKVLKGGK